MKKEPPEEWRGSESKSVTEGCDGEGDLKRVRPEMNPT
jgi:hypothetical protein